MRSRFAVLSGVLSVCVWGCGKEKPVLSAPTVEIGEASKTELTLLQPPAHSAFQPAEVVTIKGSFTVAKGFRVSFVPKVLVILSSANASVDGVRAKLKEHPPGAAVPFEAEIQCPQTPGKYAILATMNVEQDGSEKQTTAESNRIEFEVAKP